MVCLLVTALCMVAPAGDTDALNRLRPADTSSPRDTLRSFTEACEDVYEFARDGRRGTLESAEAAALSRRVLSCLDLDAIPAYQKENAGREAAAYLKEVLDRADLPPADQIPDRGMMKDASGELRSRWRIPGTPILMTLATEGPAAGTYRFSADTVERAKDFYQTVEDLPYKDGATPGLVNWYLYSAGKPWLSAIVRCLPDFMRKPLASQAAWQWVALAITLVVGVLVMAIAYRYGRASMRTGPDAGAVRYSLALLFPVAAMLVPYAVRDFITDTLVITGPALIAMRFSLALVGLLAGMAVIISLGQRISALIIHSPRINPKSIDAQFIRLVGRLVSLAVAMVVFLEGGKYLGLPITTLLAGAGVAGAALALSAQDTIKNIFGSMTILLDKPYRVGERIKVGSYDGLVEEIGLRSTRIRLLNGHQTIIPNDSMARSDIENIGRRPYIRRLTDIPLRMDISSQDAARAVEIVEGILDSHEGMDPEFPPRVWLNDFQRDHLTLRFISWYHPPNYWDYGAYGTEINRRLLQAFAEAGIRMALPSATTYLARDLREQGESGTRDDSTEGAPA